MKDKFIQFLKDNGAYEKFCENCNGKGDNSEMEDGLNDCSIIDPFVWPDDEVVYWFNLHKKWSIILNSESNG
jgi:hypothetical protein